MTHRADAARIAEENSLYIKLKNSAFEKVEDVLRLLCHISIIFFFSSTEFLVRRAQYNF